MKIKSLLSILACVALLLSLLCVTAVAAPAATEMLDGTYEKVVENEHNILYLDKETGNVAVKNLASGVTYYSAQSDEISDKNSVGIEKTHMKSPLVIEYLYTENASATDITGIEITNTKEECSASDIETEEIKNGVRVTFSIGWLGVSIPVEYSLDGETFKASIVYEDIEEGSDIYIVSMKLLPAFGAAKMTEEGYLVVPDGSGAVINFNNGKVVSEYTANVYGDEINPLSYVDKIRGERVLMPIFGIVKNNSALLGVITEGDDSAAIFAHSSAAKKYGYNIAGAKAIYRHNSQVSMFGTDWEGSNVSHWVKASAEGNFTISYFFLGADKASYQGVASAYQDYLVETDVLKQSERKPSMHLDIYGSIDKTTAFLGFKYKKQVPLTTYNQAKSILSELIDAGITDITAEYIGWANNGITNQKLPTKVKYESTLGGKKKFNSLKNFAKENGITLAGNADFAYAVDIARGSAMKSFFNKLLHKYAYRNSVYTERRNTERLIANANKVKSTALKYLKSYNKTNLDTISMDTLGEYFYSNFSKNGSQSKKYLIEKVEELLAAYKEAGYSISLSDAPAYTFAYADIITAAPIGSSCCEIFDYDIPLYQLVLHGYVTLTTESLPQTIDEELTYLWAVSTGTEPMYNTIYKKASVLQETEYDHLYSSTFDWWKDEAIEKYSEYSKLLSRIYNKKITRYTELLPNVVETVFANSITVYVNYNSTEQTVNGIKIPARSYKWIGGDNE